MKQRSSSSNLKVASVTAASAVPSPPAPLADKTMSKGAEAAAPDSVEMAVAAAEPPDSFGLRLNRSAKPKLKELYIYVWLCMSEDETRGEENVHPQNSATSGLPPTPKVMRLTDPIIFFVYNLLKLQL